MGLHFAKIYISLKRDIIYNLQLTNYKQTLAAQFAESLHLEKEIMKQLDAFQFNPNIGNHE